jgi:hypothetical protein
LIKSIPGVLQLEAIVVFVLMILSVLHTILFSGKFNFCHTEKLNLSKKSISKIINNKWDCINFGGEWMQRDFNFDDFWSSFLTLVSIQTLESWVPIMW